MFNQIQEANLIPDANNVGSTVQLTDTQFLKKQPSPKRLCHKEKKEGTQRGQGLPLLGPRNSGMGPYTCREGGINLCKSEISCLNAQGPRTPLEVTVLV